MRMSLGSVAASTVLLITTTSTTGMVPYNAWSAKDFHGNGFINNFDYFFSIRNGSVRLQCGTHSVLL